MCLIEDQSWIDCIDITSRWDTFVLFHLYGNKGVSLPLWPIRPRWFHTYSPCAEPLGDGHEGMWARFGSQGSIALNWHSRYSGTRYSGTWLYYENICHATFFHITVLAAFQISYMKLQPTNLVDIQTKLSIMINLVPAILGLIKLEIVDQWSTRIPPLHRRGWHCSKSQGRHFESDIADNR